MTSSDYRPPRDCPVCTDRLQITQLGCPTCGTGLVGQFRSCEFCGLDEAERDILRVFLASRGNMKDLERHLGVSYPTARARFEDLLRTLGLAERPEAAKPPGTDPRLTTLQALAAGSLDVESARQALDDGPPT